jgi:hypothetical protein
MRRRCQPSDVDLAVGSAQHGWFRGAITRIKTRARKDARAAPTGLFLLMVVLSQDSAALHPGLSSFHPYGVKMVFWGVLSLRFILGYPRSTPTGWRHPFGVLSQDCAAFVLGYFRSTPTG